MKPLDPLAFHEAGHVAAALAVGVPVKRAWICPTWRISRGVPLSGAVEYPEGVFVPYSWQVAVLLAGPAAEELYQTDQPDGITIGHEDILQAREALAGCPWIDRGEALGAVLGWLGRPDVWPVVERIAQELLRRQEIPGEELDGVAWETVPNPGRRRAWGEPLRRALPPAATITPGVEREILLGLYGRTRAFVSGRRSQATKRSAST